METKLSKKQSNVLVILCEGDIVYNHRDQSLSLEDGDNNSYYLRNDTFRILLSLQYIEHKNTPAMDIERYGLSKKGEEYLMKHHHEEIKDFIS